MYIDFQVFYVYTLSEESESVNEDHMIEHC